MDSMGLITINCASNLVPKLTVLPNRLPTSSPPGPFNVSSLSPSSWKKAISKSRSLSLVVRAQENEYQSGVDNIDDLAALENRVVHSPYTITEDEHELKMVLDMPGVRPDDVDVKVTGDTLSVKDMGRLMNSPYDTLITLPPYVEKQDINATFINGVLHVSMPKKTILVPFKEEEVVDMENKEFVPAIELEEWQNKTSLVDFPNYVRMPWGNVEDEKMVKVSMDVPGLTASDLRVCIMGDLLVVDEEDESGKFDDLGRKIAGCHAKFLLPKACIREQSFAVLKFGILYITVPKCTLDHTVVPLDVPVRSA